MKVEGVASPLDRSPGMRGVVTAEAAARLFSPLGRCRDVEEFEKLNRIGEGTYGTVYRARDRRSQQIVALKRVLLHNESSEGVRGLAECLGGLGGLWV